MVVDGSGVPIDSDVDGIPDYMEDANGNGVVDSGETNPGLSDTDGDGISDFSEVQHGLNPLVADPALSIKITYPEDQSILP